MCIRDRNTSSISLLESAGSKEGLSIKIEIQFSKVLSLWEPQDSIRCLHLFNDLYLSRRDKVPRRLCLEFFKVVKNNSSGLIKNIEDKIHSGKLKALNSSVQLSGNYSKELEAYVLEDKPRKVKEIMKSYCL